MQNKKNNVYNKITFIHQHTNDYFTGTIHSLTYEEIQKHKEYIKIHGIQQFCINYNNVKDNNYDTLKWGDEVANTSITRGSLKNTIFINIMLP